MPLAAAMRQLHWQCGGGGGGGGGGWDVIWRRSIHLAVDISDMSSYRNLCDFVSE